MAKKQIEYFEGLPIIEANDYKKFLSQVEKLGDTVSAPFAVRTSSRAKSIKFGAFANATNIEVAILTENIQGIEGEAFKDCMSLKKVITTEGLKSISYSSFEGCTALEEFLVPSTVEIIGNGAFKNCTSLKKVVATEGIKSICYSSFEGCTALTEFQVPSTVTLINWDAFRGCSNLAKITLPEGLESMTKCFEGCNSLTELSVPPLVGADPEAAFLPLNERFSNMIEGLNPDCKIILSENDTTYKYDESGKCILSKDGKELVYSLTNVENVEVPEGVETLLSNCFKGRENLKQVILPSSVKNLKYNVFENCPSLELVKLPATIENAGTETFKDSLNVKVVIANNDKEVKFYKYTYLPVNLIVDNEDEFERNLILLINKSNQDQSWHYCVGVNKTDENNLFVEYDDDSHFTAVVDGKIMYETF